MKEYELNKYISNSELVNQKMNDFVKEKIITFQEQDNKEIEGHLLKCEHNLQFVKDNINLDYLDWAITGCYYASYHAALALIMTKKYSSKNHLATLIIIIKEFYNNGLDKKDIETFARLLDYQDILFYVESKNKREDATYSTTTKFDKKEVEQLRIKATLFVSKIRSIIDKMND